MTEAHPEVHRTMADLSRAGGLSLQYAVTTELRGHIPVAQALHDTR
jgi:hypothetical protein